MKHFIRRHISKPSGEPAIVSNVPEEVEIIDTEKAENKKTKKDKNMTNDNIEQMVNIANELSPEQTTKRIKKDKGLIERIESEKTMLTEDNKQLLLG